MVDWIAELTSVEKIFFYCAAVADEDIETAQRLREHIRSLAPPERIWRALAEDQ